MREATVNSILARAATTARIAAGDDPFQSPNEEVRLLVNELRTLGDDLASEYPWPQLKRFWLFDGAGQILNPEDGLPAGPSIQVRDFGIPQEESEWRGYRLPDDWYGFVANTAFDRGETWPMFGPASPERWAWTTGRAYNPVINEWRIIDREVAILPRPVDEDVLSFEYQSTAWVRFAEPPTGDVDGRGMSFVSGADTLLFDRRVLEAGTVLRYKEAKGLMADAERMRFQRLLAQSKGLGTGTSRMPLGTDTYVSNIPDTGFGE